MKKRGMGKRATRIQSFLFNKKILNSKRSNSHFGFVVRNNIFSKSRRSQAQIITIVLIILIVLVALIIVWNVIQSLIGSTAERISLGRLIVDLKVKYACTGNDNKEVYAAISRKIGKANLTALKFVFTDSSGKNYIYKYPLFDEIPDELETKVYNITALGVRNQNPDLPADWNFTDIVSVGIAFVVRTNSGEEITSNIKHEFEGDLSKECGLAGNVDTSVYEGGNGCTDDPGCTAVGIPFCLGDVVHNCSLGGDECLDINSGTDCTLTGEICQAGSCVEATEVTGCMELNQLDTIYTLTQDVNSSGTCFTISADDIILDCNGHLVNYSQSLQGYGIYDNGYDNFTVKNCVIVQGDTSTAASFGIYFVNANNGTIKNNNFETGTHAIRMDGSANNTINNNIINTSEMGAIGIYFTAISTMNTIVNNTVTIGNSAGNGISLQGGSNSIIENNTIFTLYSSNSGIDLWSSQSNIIKNNTINTPGTNSYAFEIRDNSDSNLIEDNNIIESGSDAFRLDASGSNYPENNNLTNNTLLNIVGYDLNFVDAGINYTYLIDQPIRNYSFTGAGGIIYVKDSAYGEIKFLEAVNGAGTNLSNDIQISSNSIFVNSTNNIGLNKSADISIYGLGFADAKPQFDLEDDGTFIDCTAFTDPACSKLSYSGGTLVFNTTHFTTFKAAEM